MKSHLVFTTDGFKAISDEKKQHSCRRKKGKRFFNEEWRDLLLAYLQRLKDKEGNIKIEINQDGQILTMKEWPEMFWSAVGYPDPTPTMDLDKVEDYFESPIEDVDD